MKIFLKSLFFILIGILSPIFFYLNIISAANTDLIINEIMYDPKGSDADKEWIEILNIGSQNIVLNKNWRFVDSYGNHIINEPILGDFILEPNEYAILTSDPQTFLNNYSDFNGTLIKVALYLKNTSDNLKILDDQKNEIATLNYSKDLGASENNKTLEIVSPLNPTILKESLIEFGTPGKQNSVYQPTNQQQEPSQQNPSQENSQAQNSANENQQTNNNEQNNYQSTQNNQLPTNKTSNESENQDINSNQNEILQSQSTNNNQNLPQINPIQEKKIFINEILANPFGSDQQYEWIEIYNDNENEIDLSDWQIKNDNQIFKIPKNTKISAKSFLIFGRPATKITLSNNGGKLELLNNQNILIQQIAYQKSPKENYSYARTKNNNWEFTSIPTPGTENIFFKINKEENKENKSKQFFKQNAQQNLANLLNALNETETIKNNNSDNLKEQIFFKIALSGIILGVIAGALILFVKIKLLK